MTERPRRVKLFDPASLADSPDARAQAGIPATPEPKRDASAKNFLFFEAAGGLHVIALIEPHVVYSLTPLHGHAHVAHMATAQTVAMV